MIRLGEWIGNGQRVARYTVSGLGAQGWRTLSSGTTIGYAKIDRFPTTTVTRVHVTIDEALDTPEPINVSVYG